jgi:hypothetical protein
MARTTWASEVAGVSGSRARATPPHARAAPDAQTDTRGRGEAWVHRHRRELAVVWPIALLAGVSELGHVSAPGLVLVPLPAGLLAALALATWGTRPIHRWGVAGAALGGVWATAAWWSGIDNGPVAVALGVLGGTAVTVWWRYQHPRSRIEVIGGSPWPWHGEAWRWQRGPVVRELAGVAAVWPWIAEKAGVPGAHLRHMVADIDEGRSLHVDLARGHVGKDIKPDRLASALREFPVTIATPDPRRPWEIVLQEQLEHDDELHREEPEDTEEEAPEEQAPPAQDPDEIGRRFVLMAIQRAGRPISGREAAKLARVQKDRGARYVKELAAAGLIVQPEEGGGWTVAEGVAA